MHVDIAFHMLLGICILYPRLLSRLFQRRNVIALRRSKCPCTKDQNLLPHSRLVENKISPDHKLSTTSVFYYQDQRRGPSQVANLTGWLGPYANMGS